MLIHFTQLIVGFSIFGAAVLLFAYLFFLPGMRKSLPSKVACFALLVELSYLQFSHYIHFLEGVDLLLNWVYLYLLLVVPPTFYFFSRAILFPEKGFKAWHFIHALPLTAGLLISKTSIPAFAFLIGTAYTFWFANAVYQLRQHSSRFKFEMFFFGLFALFALLSLLLGLSIPYMDHVIFYAAYANFIGLALLLVLAALIVFPDMLSDIASIIELSYANSTLNGVDIGSTCKDIDQLMIDDKIYQNENLSVAMVAEMLDLTAHQLSELINTHYGCGFPRFVREKRVEQAKKILVDDPKASILSISMMTGFKSQSNFYSAFREITGETPGAFRKHTLSS